MDISDARGHYRIALTLSAEAHHSTTFPGLYVGDKSMGMLTECRVLGMVVILSDYPLANGAGTIKGSGNGQEARHGLAKFDDELAPATGSYRGE